MNVKYQRKEGLNKEPELERIGLREVARGDEEMEPSEEKRERKPSKDKRREYYWRTDGGKRIKSGRPMG